MLVCGPYFLSLTKPLAFTCDCLDSYKYFTRRKGKGWGKCIDVMDLKNPENLYQSVMSTIHV